VRRGAAVFLLAFRGHGTRCRFSMMYEESRIGLFIFSYFFSYHLFIYILLKHIYAEYKMKHGYNF